MSFFQDVNFQANREIHEMNQKQTNKEKKRIRREQPIKRLIRHHREEIEKYIDAFISDNLVAIQTAVILKKKLECVLNKRKGERQENELKDCRQKFLDYQSKLKTLHSQYLDSYFKSGRTDLGYNEFVDCKINTDDYLSGHKALIRMYLYRYYQMEWSAIGDEASYHIALYETVFSKRYLNPHIKRLNLALSVVDLDIN